MKINFYLFIVLKKIDLLFYRENLEFLRQKFSMDTFLSQDLIVMRDGFDILLPKVIVQRKY